MINLETLTLEERALIKGLKVNNKKELMNKLQNITVEDSFTQEFINDLLKKIKRK